MQALLDQATTLHSQGKLAEAECLYKKILDSAPEQADALALLGLVVSDRQAFDEAISLLERAIVCDPETPLFRFYLGNVLLNMGEEDRAIGAFQDTLARAPDFSEAHFCLALLLEKQSKLIEAVQHLEETLRIKPQEGSAWVKLSELALKTGDHERAGAAAEKAVELMPESLAAQVALALAFEGLNREEEAVVALERALVLRPDFVEAWDMLGAAYQQVGRLNDAEAAFHQAIALARCGIVDEHSREVDEEEYSIQHWNLSVLELLKGDFSRGFAHYRARFKNPGRPGRLMFPQPLWRGEDISGKKMLVVGEQGFGDVLMMCRYAPLLKAKGAKVVLLAHQALVPLLEAAAVADEVSRGPPADQGDFNFQTSLFDLPLRFGTTTETIPTPVPYIPSPPPDAETRLADDGRAKIGIVWAGKKEYGNDRRRSLSLNAFTELFDETEAHFYSLMRDIKPEEAALLLKRGVSDLGAKLTDFLVTARIVAQLDLVITCDTAMAHLAGAMGKTVWVLLPFAPDWRWLTDREDSSWYPTMRLFRQKNKGDWAEVIGRVREAMAALIQEKHQ